MKEYLLYLIPTIGLPLALYLSVRIDLYFREKERKKTMYNMYNFWDDD